MKLYADTPARRTRQLLVDAFVLGWIAAWVWVSKQVYDVVLGLAAPGRAVEEAGRDLSGGLADAAEQAGRVPVVGRTLRERLADAGGAGEALARAGQSEQDVVGDLALVLALVIGSLAILVVLVRWLPDRVRWVREASAAAGLRSGGSVELFALRALARRPLRELAAVGPDPAGAFVRGDPVVARRLAELELSTYGLRAEELPIRVPGR